MNDDTAVASATAQRFLDLFDGLKRAHGVYMPGGVADEKGKLPSNATTVHEPVTVALVASHLEGRQGLGLCPVRDDATVRFGAIDIDVYAGLDHVKIARDLLAGNLPLIPCRSKSGGCHIYLFTSEPVSAAAMQKRLGEIAASLGHGGVEIFPKQTSLPADGFGSWINLPHFAGTRYSILANGDAMTLEQFLDQAEASRVPASWFGGTGHGTRDTGAKTRNATKRKFVIPDAIGDGARDKTLTSLAGAMRRNAMSVEAIHAALRETNAEKCKPPLADEDLARIAKSVGRYEPAGDGFTSDETGVHFTGSGKDDSLPVFVCGPLNVEAYARSTANDGWSLLLSFQNRDNQRHELLIGLGSLELPGNKWLVDLLDAGLEVGDKALLKRYLQSRKIDKRMRLVDRIGWTGDRRAFMLPSGPVPRISGEEWVYKGIDRVLFGTKGTLEDWRQHVAKYCVGNSRLMFATSSAFLAPLLPLIGASEGRAFHYFHDSSSGKTTALQVAGSVCGGGGKLGFLQTWNSTLNAMEGIAAAHNHCILLLDELGEMDSRKAGQLAYVIVGGEGKKRLSRTAELRESLTWLNVVFSSGEISLERHMKATDSDARLMGGQEVRIISIPADTESGHGVFEDLHGMKAGVFADMLKRASAESYGTALVEWLNLLAARRDDLVQRSRKIADDFKAMYARTAGPQVGRVAEAFGLVAAAGTLATESGITGWAENAVSEAAAKCFNAWLKERGTDGSSDEASIIRQVRKFYQLHGESRFKRQHDDSKTVFNQAGYIVGDEFWTFDQVFESEVCKGFEPKQAGRALKKHSCLVTENERLKVKRSAKGIPRARFYVIRRDAIFGEDQQLPLAA